jgi:hypothetical protein
MYTTLLILTDGVVSDDRAAAQSLSDSCDDPLSILIVGINTCRLFSNEIFG